MIKGRLRPRGVRNPNSRVYRTEGIDLKVVGELAKVVGIIILMGVISEGLKDIL